MQMLIVIIGCFDTKGPAFAFLRDCLIARGESVLTINAGVMETAVDFPIDFPAERVAQNVRLGIHWLIFDWVMTESAPLTSWAREQRRL